MAKIEQPDKLPEESKKETQHRIEKTDPNKYGDIFFVEGLPKGMEGFWANNKREQLEIAKYRDGYVTVTSDNAPDAKTICKQTDGTHQIGDAILMMRPKEMSEKKRKEVQELRRMRMKRSRSEYLEMAHKMGLKPIDEER